MNREGSLKATVHRSHVEDPLSQDDIGISLLPNLPNHLVMSRILPRIPWYTKALLPCLSPSWKAALEEVPSCKYRLASTKPAPIIIAFEKEFYMSNLFIYDDKWRKSPPGMGQGSERVAVTSGRGTVYMFFSDETTLEGGMIQISEGSFAWEIIPPRRLDRTHNIVFAGQEQVFMFPESLETYSWVYDFYPGSGDKSERRPVKGWGSDVHVFHVGQRAWGRLNSLMMPINCEFEGKCVFNSPRGLTYVGVEYHSKEKHLVSFTYDMGHSAWECDVIEKSRFDAIGFIYFSIFGNLFKVSESADFQFFRLSTNGWLGKTYNLPMHKNMHILDVMCAETEQTASLYVLELDDTAEIFSTKLFQGTLENDEEVVTWQEISVTDIGLPGKYCAIGQKLAVYQWS